VPQNQKINPKNPPFCPPRTPKHHSFHGNSFLIAGKPAFPRIHQIRRSLNSSLQRNGLGVADRTFKDNRYKNKQAEFLPSSKAHRRKLSGDKNEPNRQREARIKAVRRNEPSKGVRIKRKDNEERRLQRGVPENDGSELKRRIEKHVKEKD
jgi:hypothetical protein